ncbi:hypothetical protein [Mycobacterium palustre]|uniref:hypothetical protein n=1 Tax=Mycobacterium palustre TaxID=153971 RepID=UPI00115144E1|nr:hypothetical protein [Mycobacterium palustre]MCV7101799.1 hypothetical protein [Mycobacterium palustre]
MSQRDFYLRMRGSVIAGADYQANEAGAANLVEPCLMCSADVLPHPLSGRDVVLRIFARAVDKDPKVLLRGVVAGLGRIAQEVGVPKIRCAVS